MPFALLPMLESIPEQYPESGKPDSTGSISDKLQVALNS